MPSAAPTVSEPSETPSYLTPGPTAVPTPAPTVLPTPAPTPAPTTAAPTAAPTEAPTSPRPTPAPSTSLPSPVPTTGAPTSGAPSAAPSVRSCAGRLDPDVCGDPQGVDCTAMVSRVTCPALCGACGPTVAPTAAPTVPMCNGVLDPALCDDTPLENCVNAAAYCPVRCSACPPTPSPTFVPSEQPTMSTSQTTTATSTATTSARGVTGVHTRLVSAVVTSPQPRGLLLDTPFLVYPEQSTLSGGETSAALLDVSITYENGDIHDLSDSQFLVVETVEASRFPATQLVVIGRNDAGRWLLQAGNSWLDGWVRLQITADIPGHTTISSEITVYMTSFHDLVPSFQLLACKEPDGSTPSRNPVMLRRIGGTDPVAYQTAQVSASSVILTNGVSVPIPADKILVLGALSIAVVGSTQDWAIDNARRTFQPTVGGLSANVTLSFWGNSSRAATAITSSRIHIVEVTAITAVHVRAHREGCPMLEGEDATLAGLPGASADTTIDASMSDGSTCRLTAVDPAALTTPEGCTAPAAAIYVQGMLHFSANVPSALQVSSSSGQMVLWQNHVDQVVYLVTAPDLGSDVRLTTSFHCNIDPVRTGDWDFGLRMGAPLPPRTRDEEFEIEFRVRTDAEIEAFKFRVQYDDSVIALAGTEPMLGDAVANRNAFNFIGIAKSNNAAVVTGVLGQGHKVQPGVAAVAIRLTFVVVGHFDTATTVSGAAIELVSSTLGRVGSSGDQFTAGYAVQRISRPQRARRGHRTPTIPVPFLEATLCNQPPTVLEPPLVDLIAAINNHAGAEACAGIVYTPAGSDVGWCGATPGCGSDPGANNYPPGDLNRDCCVSLADSVVAFKHAYVAGLQRDIRPGDCYDVGLAMSVATHAQESATPRAWTNTLDSNNNGIWLEFQDAELFAASTVGVLPLLDDVTVSPVELDTSCQMHLSAASLIPVPAVRHFVTVFRITRSIFTGVAPAIGPGTVGTRLDSSAGHCAESLVIADQRALSNGTAVFTASFTTDFDVDVNVAVDVAIWNGDGDGPSAADIADVAFDGSATSICFDASHGTQGCFEFIPRLATGQSIGNRQGSASCWPPCSDREYEVAPATPHSPPECEFLTTSQTSTATTTVTSTSMPTSSPSTSIPTLAPTQDPTSAPTSGPSSTPTPAPTLAPTPAPTPAPTLKPSPLPSQSPILAPTPSPTPIPTSAAPTEAAPTGKTDVTPSSGPITDAPLTVTTPDGGTDNPDGDPDGSSGDSGLGATNAPSGSVTTIDGSSVTVTPQTTVEDNGPPGRCQHSQSGDAYPCVSQSMRQCSRLAGLNCVWINDTTTTPPDAVVVVTTPSDDDVNDGTAADEATSADSDTDTGDFAVAIIVVSVIAFVVVVCNLTLFNNSKTIDDAVFAAETGAHTQVQLNQIFTPTHTTASMLVPTELVKPISDAPIRVEIEDLDTLDALNSPPPPAPAPELVPELAPEPEDYTPEILPGVSAEGRVYIFSKAPNANIRYCVDDDFAVPYVNYVEYPPYLPMNVAREVKVRAQCFVEGRPVSEIVSKAYVLQRVAEPSITVARSEKRPESCFINITCKTPGAQLLYRVSGVVDSMLDDSPDAPLAPNDVVVKIPRNEGEMLGLKLAAEAAADGHFIELVAPEGVAAMTGKIKVGMKLTSINSVRTASMSREECVALLRFPAEYVTLGLTDRSHEYDEYDESLVADYESQNNHPETHLAAGMLEYDPDAKPVVPYSPDRLVTITAIAVQRGWVTSALASAEHVGEANTASRSSHSSQDEPLELAVKAVNAPTIAAEFDVLTGLVESVHVHDDATGQHLLRQ